MKARARSGRGAWPFVGGFAAAAALAGGLYLALRPAATPQEAREERLKQVESEAEPARKALEPAPQPEPYDVEATLRAVRELDLAVKRSGSVRQFLETVSRGDYRRVAPKLLESRKRIVDVLVKYYGALDKQRQEEELWGSFGRLSDELARVLQATDIKAATPFGTVSLNPSDPARQKVLAEERAKREANRAATFAEVQRFEEELLYALDAAVPVFRELEDEWMRLCAQRDRVYLQVAARDHADAAQSARTALELAPGDVEATLLLALALIERDREKPAGERANEVEALLADVLQREPDNAPALVLRGMWRWIRGEASEGRSDLELAASRYPLQAERLRDELDPYSKREYLRRTRQGGRVTALYRTMMLGANHFSPDLQLARAQLDAGDAAGAFERVKDHFARRRVQGQWDLVLYDLEFCEDLLGDRYREYVPEKSYLDLEVEEQLIGSAVNVTVHNRSDRALRNAALVLAVRFTDMVEGEYATFTVGKTQPEIVPLARTKFGSVEVAYTGLGEPKGFADAVKPLRAVLICDDGVFFIDTIEHKGELARAAEPAPQEPGSLAERVLGIARALSPENLTIGRVKNLVSSDSLEIELPRELVLLGPLFHLDIGSKTFDEARGDGVEHRIEGGKLRLRFDSVGKTLDGYPGEVRLVAESALGDFAVVLGRNEAGNYVFRRVELP